MDKFPLSIQKKVKKSLSFNFSFWLTKLLASKTSNAGCIDYRNYHRSNPSKETQWNQEFRVVVLVVVVME